MDKNTNRNHTSPILFTAFRVSNATTPFSQKAKERMETATTRKISAISSIMKRLLEERVIFSLISVLGLKTSQLMKIAANKLIRMSGLSDVRLTRAAPDVNIFFKAGIEKKMTTKKMQKCPTTRKTRIGIFFTDIPDRLILYPNGKCFNAAPIA